jgi:hypothetical protein
MLLLDENQQVLTLVADSLTKSVRPLPRSPVGRWSGDVRPAIWKSETVRRPTGTVHARQHPLHGDGPRPVPPNRDTPLHHAPAHPEAGDLSIFNRLLFLHLYIVLNGSVPSPDLRHFNPRPVPRDGNRSTCRPCPLTTHRITLVV